MNSLHKAAELYPNHPHPKDWMAMQFDGEHLDNVPRKVPVPKAALPPQEIEHEPQEYSA